MTYLSRDPSHLAALQRVRRNSVRRVDYMPGKEALAVFAYCQAKQRPGSQAATNSSVLDAIVCEWAELTGINNQCFQSPMTSANQPELSDANTRARMSSGEMPDWLLRSMARTESRTKQARRVICGAKRHRDGQPCQAKSEAGKKRCRFHGGRSTGPRTAEGKAKALANLRRGRYPATEKIAEVACT